MDWNYAGMEWEKEIGVPGRYKKQIQKQREKERIQRIKEIPSSMFAKIKKEEVNL